MTELYKRNGAVFIPAGITIEEIEELKDTISDFEEIGFIKEKEIAEAKAKKLNK